MPFRTRKINTLILTQIKDLNIQVKPVIKLLKQTLVGTGALLVAAVSLFIFATPVEDFVQKTFFQKLNPSHVSASKTSTTVNIRSYNEYVETKPVT